MMSKESALAAVASLVDPSCTPVVTSSWAEDPAASVSERTSAWSSEAGTTRSLGYVWPSCLSRTSYVRWYGLPSSEFELNDPNLPILIVLRCSQYVPSLLCLSSGRLGYSEWKLHLRIRLDFQ
jgi:hypothetical protein